ncbi:NADP-dependent oxidoreductase [Salirhabdus sp. Marseille-P4669]|uniref:NADP-dependent oxidoreductase n=1 Tax=Salirhabdus sp. Marseille-P4669 TaxID=2042310 RepID=UPI000C7DF587|nr:NADP-dependent oxidoreductase [Salirhabdus sp. Marseille-P4669]
MKNEQIILKSYPQGMPTDENFEFRTVSVPDLQDEQVLVRTIYLSVDPYMRGRMSTAKSYVPPYQLNEVLKGYIVGEVVESKSDRLLVGDKVTGELGWQRYNAIDAKYVRKVDSTFAPLSSYLSVLGLTGLTAYFGLLDIGQPKEGETVVVSGAAGAVGMVVGQIAKIKGARVVGIAGSSSKIKYLEEELGFDATVNYKEVDNVRRALKEACPSGIDVYFDNVGGPISDAAISLLNDYARIPVCGAISAYNITSLKDDFGPRVQPTLIKTRALMKGFIVSDYASKFKQAASDLGKWLAEGKIKYQETVVEGFENVPNAFLGLFKGQNIGKQLVKVSE